MERSLVRRWNNVLRLIEDDRNAIETDDHNLVSALGMAVGYTRRNTERFTREAIRTEQMPAVSQTGPDDVKDEARDAARMESAFQTWVKEEDTRELAREAERFPQDGESMVEQDVPEKEIDIRTVMVTPADGGGDLGEALLEVGKIWPVFGGNGTHHRLPTGEA